MRVVLDTNVVVSALLSPDGIPAAILDLATQGRIHAVVSEETLDELDRVLSRPRHGFPRRKVAAFMAFFESRAIRVRRPSPLTACTKDPSDNRILECAAAGKARYLVTGNPGHFPKRHKGIQTITPRQFWEIYIGRELLS